MSLGIENIHRSNHSIFFPQSYGSPFNDTAEHISNLGLRRLDFERCAVAGEVLYTVEGDSTPISQQDSDVTERFESCSAPSCVAAFSGNDCVSVMASKDRARSRHSTKLRGRTGLGPVDPGARSQRFTIRSCSGEGSGRMRIALRNVKTALFAPIPSAKE